MASLHFQEAATRQIVPVIYDGMGSGRGQNGGFAILPAIAAASAGVSLLQKAKPATAALTWLEKSGKDKGPLGKVAHGFLSGLKAAGFGDDGQPIYIFDDGKAKKGGARGAKHPRSSGAGTQRKSAAKKSGGAASAHRKKPAAKKSGGAKKKAGAKRK